MSKASCANVAHLIRLTYGGTDRYEAARKAAKPAGAAGPEGQS